jgi:radical SAM superfamily enzyme YgiQ (UPF0313 family)
MVVYRKDNPDETYLYTPVLAQPNAVRVAFCYPASYQIAMSSLGFMILFKQMDVHPDIDVTRVYSDTLQDFSANQFEVMGFSFSFELDTVNILKNLEDWKIPLLAEQRERSHPFVFSGGPVPMSNPEPYADFFDFFLIGEGEQLMSEAMLTIAKYRDLPNRQDVLRKLAAEVVGVYVPSLYEISYTSNDGPIASITPRFDDAPMPVHRRIVVDMTDHVATTPILTDKSVYSSTYLVEVMRGCAHRCRFCLASYSTLPARGAGADPIISKLEEGLRHSRKIGLLGALISDHPQFDEICDYLHHQMDRLEGQGDSLTISSSSLRADTLSVPIAKTFKRGKQRQLTIAVESGSERLRRRINKNLKHDQILKAAGVVAEAGMKGLKIYGMVGLPDETDADVEQLAVLMRELRSQNPKLELHLGSSSFVPKAGTPFQWQAKLDSKTIEARFALLKKALGKTADLRPSSAKWDYFQAVLSRGDRRLSKLLLRFYALGGSLGSIKRAYKELCEENDATFPTLDWYAIRERPEHEVLPWDMIHLGVDKHILYKEGLPPPGFENLKPDVVLAHQSHG